ncbi:MAG: F0F1 ATP synthase subunit B [Fluviicola sp.]|jgi:F-type H+-transporting ATPase subunit b
MNTLINDFSPGLFIMQTLILVILILLLRKFAWKPILDSLQSREEGIQNAIDAAENAKAEMQQLKSQNENLLAQARAERDAIVKDAKEVATKMVEDAKNTAKNEANKIVEAAHVSIKAEKVAAIAELKSQVAAISLEIAEKILRGELSADDKHKALAEKMAADINMN